MKQTIFNIAGFCVLFLVFVATAQADDVYQATSMALNKTWTDVTDGGNPPKNHFSDGKAAHSGSDYFVGRLRDRSVPPGQTATVTLRTPPTGADATFPGDSLTVDTQGAVSYKQSGTRKLTINNMKLIGTGSFGNAQPNSTCTLYGDMTLHDTPTWSMSSSTDFRNIDCYALLQGDGTLTMNGDNVPAYFKHYLFSNDNNTFSGNLVINNALFILASPKAVYTVAKITLNNYAKVQPTANVIAPNTDLVVTANAQILLDKDINLKSCTINGTALSTGVHTGTELATSFATNIVNNGGSITVGVPPVQPNSVKKAWLFE